MNNESITIPTKDTPKPHNDKKVLLEAMKYRYATKKFDPEKIISDEDFETLLEAARLSPTSFGMEPWKILVIQNRKIREEMMPYGWGARAGLSGAPAISWSFWPTREKTSPSAPPMQTTC